MIMTLLSLMERVTSWADASSDIITEWSDSNRITSPTCSGQAVPSVKGDGGGKTIAAPDEFNQHDPFARTEGSNVAEWRERLRELKEPFYGDRTRCEEG